MHKILIIDDDLTFIKIFTALLKDAGYSAFGIDNCRDIFTSLKEIKPDLLILDISMPEISGYEVMGLIKSEPQFENLPIILFSSFPCKLNPETIAAIGIDYLPKSCNPKELIDKISHILNPHTPQKKIEKKEIEEHFKQFFEHDHIVSDGIKRIIEFRVQRSLKYQTDKNKEHQD